MTKEIDLKCNLKNILTYLLICVIFFPLALIFIILEKQYPSVDENNVVICECYKHPNWEED